MISYKDLIELLRKNEEIDKKFHEIETRILSILNFRDLFEILLTEIQQQFRVPYAWITLIENCEVSDLVKYKESSNTLRTRIKIVERDLFTALVGHRRQPLLVNENIDPFFQLFPQGRNIMIKSIAVAPISLYGRTIGSFNQADFSRERFQPGIDTGRLEQLAIKVSLCLSNVTAHEKLKRMAYHDPLTGLLNRRVMESILSREFNRAMRYQTPLSLVFIDVNHFKKVNDTFGHDAGDALLKYLAGLLLEMSRESDVAARFAGDEFVQILPETTVDSAEKMLKRLQCHLADHPLSWQNNSIPFSISFGIASTEDDKIRRPEMLLKSADEALYRMKGSKNDERYECPQPYENAIAPGFDI
jgi:diguanylate cyclase (GGDEF)-like protein